MGEAYPLIAGDRSDAGDLAVTQESAVLLDRAESHFCGFLLFVGALAHATVRMQVQKDADTKRGERRCSIPQGPPV